MKNALTFSMLLIAGVLTLVTCTKEQKPYRFTAENLNLPAQPYLYNTVTAPNQQLSNDFTTQLQSKGVTNHGATLGRVLFYDPALSRTNNVSCSSCHDQALGFADGRKFSQGFDGGFTKRNAPGFGNLLNATNFFWDGRESDLSAMAVRPISDHVEMGLDDASVLVEKLGKTDYYPNLFKNAFGSETITQEAIGKALSQFLFSIVAADAPTNAAAQGGGGWNSNTLTFTDPVVQRGANIFFNNGCDACHGSSLTGNSFFSSTNFANIGLDAVSTDPGVIDASGRPSFMFKVPDLRNVALTAPYMHDGRFSTLRQVVDHYSDNIQGNPALAWDLGGPTNPRRLNLPESDKEALVAFLHQFTDPVMTKHERFSNPFK